MKHDNIVREKLYNHTLPVRDELWEAIESRLPPENSPKRAPFFWLVLFAAALSGGALISGLLQNKSTLQPNEIETESPSASTTNTDQQVYSESNPATDSSPPAYGKQQQESKQNKESNQKQEKSQINSSNSSLSNSSNTQHPPSGLTFQTKTTTEADQVQGSIDYSQSSANRSSTTIAFLPSLDGNTLQDEEAEIDISLLSPDPNCYKFGSTGLQYAFSADLFAGPGFSPRSFGETGGESPIYADAREATESFQYAWSAGARLNLHLRNGIAASTGILYEQSGFIFDYTDTLATQSTTRVDSFFSSDGTFLYADTTRILIFGTLIKQIHNTYRTLDIPLLVGYEFPIGHSTLMINAGPVFNLTSKQEGQILDPMLHPAHITSGASNELTAYKTNLGVSLYLGAGVLLPISDHISGLIEPRFLYRFNPVTVESYPLDEHRHHVGLNLGIRYHFN